MTFLIAKAVAVRRIPPAMAVRMAAPAVRAVGTTTRAQRGDKRRKSEHSNTRRLPEKPSNNKNKARGAASPAPEKKKSSTTIQNVTSHRVPILTKSTDPATLSTSSPYYYYKGIGSGGSYRQAKPLPVVNASPLMNTPEYIKASAFPSGIVTKNGLEASRRLLRGKKEFLDVMREEVLDKQPKRHGRPPQAYILTGHGVPPQLLQDHIDMADVIMTQYNAHELEFDNFSSDEYEDHLSFDRIMVRGAVTEDRVMFPWPSPHGSLMAGHDLEHRMHLFLTVMNRMAALLSSVLSRDAPVPVSQEDDDSDFIPCVWRKEPPYPQRWKVNCVRAMEFPKQLLPDQNNYGSDRTSKTSQFPQPVVEWIPATPSHGRSSASPGHVFIRLQGASSATKPSDSSTRRKKRAAVTLVFDAAFDDLS